MKDKVALTNCKIFNGSIFLVDHTVLIENGVITSVINDHEIIGDYDVEDLHGNLLAPGFFDIQVNGGGDTLFNDDPSVDSIKKIAHAHRQFGTTQCLPTLISDDIEKVEAAINAVDAAIEQRIPGIMGIHLEGPFLQKHKKGIHDDSKFIPLTESLIPTLSALKHGKTLITLAPDAVPCSLIHALGKAGCTVFAGHTNASYEQCIEAEQAGLAGYTHLFNAMSPLNSRSPGAVGAALSSDTAYFGIIADGHHVHPASLKLAIKAKPEHAILVTDAMPTVGGNRTNFALGNELIYVENGRCQNAQGTLAGSHLNMQDAVNNIQNFCSVSLTSALRMASLNPAKMLDIDTQFGKVKAGYNASFVVLNELGRVVDTYINGASSRLD